MKGEKSFYITNFDSKDLLDNWDYAAKAKKQLIITSFNNEIRTIGPDINSSTKELIEFVNSYS